MKNEINADNAQPILHSSLFIFKKRADTRARTGDLFITNELLYQLSHIGVPL